MPRLLNIGEEITTLYGATATVRSEIGEGGQGCVYLVDYRGQEKALKWYKPQALGRGAAAFYENLRANVTAGPPHDTFLWPLDITERRADGTFGYVMDLRPDGYVQATDLLLGHVGFPSFERAIDACLAIANSFRLLHNAGYCYQDISDGNFFVETRSGRLLICDTDNVAPNNTNLGILGTPRYMAPEIVLGKALPSIYTDRHSMAVIIFMLLCRCHPLEGRRSCVPAFTAEVQKSLYGSGALFVMDQDNHDNALHPKVHAHAMAIWACLPQYLQDFFGRAFGQAALGNPHARPSEADWIEQLVRFRSDVVLCDCGNEVFTEEGRPTVCDSCGKPLNIPYRIELAEYAVPGVLGTRIYRCQTCVCDANEALNPTGIVLGAQDGSLGLRNLTGEVWAALTPSGRSRPVGPKQVIPLRDGITFDCNGDSIAIRANAPLHASEADATDSNDLVETPEEKE